MSKAKQIIELEELINDLKKQTLDARDQLKCLRSGNNNFTDAHCEMILREVPSSDQLKSSWAEIYKAVDSGDRFAIQCATESHVSIFSKGLQSAAKERVKVILSKRLVAA
jgi:hypothetical protein